MLEYRPLKKNYGKCDFLYKFGLLWATSRSRGRVAAVTQQVSSHSDRLCHGHLLLLLAFQSFTVVRSAGQGGPVPTSQPRPNRRVTFSNTRRETSDIAAYWHTPRLPCTLSCLDRGESVRYVWDLAGNVSWLRSCRSRKRRWYIMKYLLLITLHKAIIIEPWLPNTCETLCETPR